MIHRTWKGLGAAGLLALSMGACSTSKSEQNAFIGSWLCSDLRSSGGASDAGPPGEMAQFLMEVSAPASDQILAIERTVDGGTVCTLHFTKSGTTATLNTEQTCQTLAGATMNYTMGTASIQNSSLVVNCSFEIPSSSTSGTEAMSCQQYYSGPITGGGGW